MMKKVGLVAGLALLVLLLFKWGRETRTPAPARGPVEATAPGARGVDAGVDAAGGAGAATPSKDAQGAPATGQPILLFGRVLDAAGGQPVAGAALTVYDYARDRLYEARSDADGGYRVPETEGARGAFHLEAREKHVLIVEAQGHVPRFFNGGSRLDRHGKLDRTTVRIRLAGYADGDLDFSGHRPGHRFRVVLGAGAAITGRVLDDDGNGIEGALVLVEREVDGHVLAAPVIDAIGSFGVDGVVVGVVRDRRDGRITLGIVDAETGESVAEGWYRYREKTSTAAGGFDGGRVAVNDASIARFRFLVGSDRNVARSVEVEITGTIRSVQREVELQPSDVLRVETVERGSPAGNAGLREGDFIVRYGDARVRNWAELRAATRAATQARAGSPAPVALELRRGGRALTLTVPGGRMEVELVNARLP